jgi:hypothetical protein
MGGIADSSDAPSSRWTPERILLVATFILSAGAFTFGIGANWERVTSQGARLDAFERTYVRSDVYTSDQRRLTDSIDRLNANLEKMESERTRLPRADRSTLGRQFDK